MSLFIQKHGKKELLKVLDTMHSKKKFEKIQEVLGEEIDEGLKILEDWRTKWFNYTFLSEKTAE